MADTRDIEASRPEFEEKMRAAGYRDDRHDTGEYVGVTSYRWEGWIAALASRPAEVDDEGLPVLPLPFKRLIGEGIAGYSDVFTAEQFRQGQRDAVAAGRARREKLPANAVEMVAFIGSHYNSMRDDKPDPNDIVYELTVHDLLSAFRWWFDDYELEDEPSHTTNKENG